MIRDSEISDYNCRIEYDTKYLVTVEWFKFTADLLFNRLVRFGCMFNKLLYNIAWVLIIELVLNTCNLFLGIEELNTLVLKLPITKYYHKHKYLMIAIATLQGQQTPLHLSSERGRVDIVNVLLSHDADTEVKDWVSEH